MGRKTFALVLLGVLLLVTADANEFVKKLKMNKMPNLERISLRN